MICVRVCEFVSVAVCLCHYLHGSYNEEYKSAGISSCNNDCIVGPSSRIPLVFMVSINKMVFIHGASNNLRAPFYNKSPVKILVGLPLYVAL